MTAIFQFLGAAGLFLTGACAMAWFTYRFFGDTIDSLECRLGALEERERSRALAPYLGGRVEQFGGYCRIRGDKCRKFVSPCAACQHWKG